MAAETPDRASESRERALRIEGLSQFIRDFPDPAEIVDADGRFAYVNPAFERVYGWSLAEVVGKTPRQVLQPAGTLSPVLDAAWTALRAGQSFSGEVTSRTRTGEPVEASVAVTPLFDVDGRLLCVWAVRRDLRAQVEAQTALRESEELHRQIFQQNQAVKLLIDPLTGRIEDANEAAIRFYGYPADELLSMRIWQLNMLPPDDVIAAMQRATRNESTYFRFPHRLASGEVRRVEVYSGPAVIHGRTLLFSIVHDVHEREQLEEQLRAAQRMEAVGRLAGGVAHDFNNLLFVVLNSARMLLRKEPVDGSSRATLEQIRTAAERAADLTRQLLLFSRGRENPAEIVDVGLVAEETLRLLASTLGENVTIAASLSKEPCPVRLERVHLEQVLINLAVNARDAMPSGGVLTVETGLVEIPERERPVHLQSLQAGTYVSLLVRDSGCGMTPEIMNHVFEPFFTTKDSSVGSGLGLSVTYGVVQRAGGVIQVESEPGVGSTFFMLFPRARERLSVPEVDSRATTRRGLGERILVVEDDRAVRMVVATVLDEHGYSVSQASSGLEALAAYDQATNEFDLVLTDVIMPSLSGPELAAQLWQRRPDQRVVFMTGYAGDLLVNAGLDHKQPVIHKPFTEAELLDAVTHALRRRPAVSVMV